VGAGRGVGGGGLDVLAVGEQFAHARGGGVREGGVVLADGRDGQGRVLGQGLSGHGDAALRAGRGEGQLRVEGGLQQGRGRGAEAPGPVQLQVRDELGVCGGERDGGGQVRASGPGVPAVSGGCHDGVDLAGVPYEEDLVGEGAERAELGVGHLVGLVDDQDVGAEAARVGVHPAVGGRDHDACAVAEVALASGVGDLGAQVAVAVVVAAGEQGDGGSAGGCAVRDGAGLVAGLCGDGDGEAGAAGELAGGRDDELGLAGTRRGGDDDGRALTAPDVHQGSGGVLVERLDGLGAPR
jgi:hypothetical protein